MDGLLSAYQALQPDARLDSFEDFLQFTFGWEDADAGPNTQVMFPGFAAAACPGQLAAAAAAAPRDAASADDLPGMHSDSSRLGSPFVGVDSALLGMQVPAERRRMQAMPGQASRTFVQPADVMPDLRLPSNEASAEMTAHILAMQQQLQQQQHVHIKAEVTLPPVAQQPAKAGKQRRQRQQQLPPVPVPPSAAAAEQSEQPPTQPKRRGRPAKVPGQYSRGYTAILRYRNKKKQWVAEMEADIAAKRELLGQLMEQQRELRHKHDALEAAIGTQDEMLNMVNNCYLSVGPATGTVAVAESLTATAAAAAAAAGEEQVPHTASGCSSATACGNNDTEDTGATSAAAPGTHDWAGVIPQLDAKLQQQRQEREQQQHLELSRHSSMSSVCSAGSTTLSSGSTGSRAPAAEVSPVQAAAPVQLWARYKDYIASIAAQLALEQQLGPVAAAGGAAAAAAAPAVVAAGAAAAVTDKPLPGTKTVDATGYPPLPFTLAEALAVWNLNRHVGLPKDEAGSGPSSAAGGQGQMLLNLSTGQHELVEPAFWARAVQQVSPTPAQRNKLEAAWRLFIIAIAKLNQERQVLLCKLRDADGSDAASHVWVGVGAGGCGGRRVLPGCYMHDLDGYTRLADEVEVNLMRGRLLIMLFTWAMLCMLDNKQVAQLCLGSWPFFPLMRALIGHLLGMPEVLEGAA